MICSPLQQTVSLKPTIDTLNKWYPEIVKRKDTDR